MFTTWCIIFLPKAKAVLRFTCHLQLVWCSFLLLWENWNSVYDQHKTSWWLISIHIKYFQSSCFYMHIRPFRLQFHRLWNHKICRSSISSCLIQLAVTLSFCLRSSFLSIHISCCPYCTYCKCLARQLVYCHFRLLSYFNCCIYINPQVCHEDWPIVMLRGMY